MKVEYIQNFAKNSFRYREKNDFTEHRLILDVYYDADGDLIIDLKSRYRDGLGRKITRLNDVFITIPSDNPQKLMHWQHVTGVSSQILNGEITPKGGEKNVIQEIHCGEFDRTNYHKS